MPRDAITPGSVIVFYDGICGFCNGAVRFVAHRDRRDRFRFAPLQGELANELLLGHDTEPSGADSIYVLVDYGLPTERVFSRASGILRILAELGGPWSAAVVLRLIPRRWLDRGYDKFAAQRYRLFGKLAQCPIPEPHERKKFVDLPGTKNGD